MRIAAALHDVAKRLSAAGWDATTDPDLIIQFTAKAGAGALVDLPTVEATHLKGRILLTVPVHLCAPPGRVQDLYPLLPGALDALRGSEPLTPQTLLMGDVPLPGWRTTITIRLDCEEK
jgi:hypothetical protein